MGCNQKGYHWNPTLPSDGAGLVWFEPLSGLNSVALGDQSMKLDAGKRRWSLFTWKAAEWIVRILEYGAKKYTANGWRKVDNARERYSDAAARHLAAYLQGEYLDQESGLPHLAHLGCNVNFLLELDPPEAH